MEEPIDFKTELGSLKELITEYLKNRIEYFKLSTIGYIAKLAPPLVFVAIIALMFLIFWMFINVTVAIVIGNASNCLAIGFLIVSFFNLLLGVFFVVARKGLILKPISNWVVKILVKSFDADENN